MSATVLWRSLEEGQKWIASEVVKWRRPVVVLLEGPMGAGKTQITKWIVEALNGGTNSASGGPVQSPTFGIHNRYASPLGAIDHIDLYRLESDADLESTGFWDLFRESDFVIVEWADRLPIHVWPTGWQKVRLKISVASDNSRSITCDIF